MTAMNQVSASLAAISITAFAVTAYAQSVEADSTQSAQVLEQVIVKIPKNAAVMPYDAVYERLKRFADSKLDRIKLEIKVHPKDSAISQSDIRVSLANDTQSIPIKIEADGRIELPLRPDFYKTGAEFMANQPKGTLETSVHIAPTWAGGKEVPYAEIEESVRQFQVAGRDVLGWLGYMLFFPSVHSIDIPVTYKTPNGQRLDIVKDGRVIQTFKADDKGLLKFRLDRRWSDWQPTLVFSEAPNDL
jgi:Protein of unknown function (DUF2987)